MIGLNQLRSTATRPRVAEPHRLAVMFGIGAVLVAPFFILLAGCGSSTNAPVPAPVAAKPDVTITFDSARHACVVALASEVQGSAIACSDVVPFIKDELRLASGSIYDIRTTPGANEAEMAGVGARLQAAGYRFMGGPQK
jgi:hypothetical protein